MKYNLYSDQFKGIFFMLCSSLAYVSSHSLIKGLSSYLSVPQLMFFRFIFGPLIMIPLLVLGYQQLKVPNKKLLFLRSLFAMLGMTCYFIALGLSDLGKISLIFHLSVVWSALLAVPIFKESLSKTAWLCLPVIMIGTALVLDVQEGLDFSKAEILALLGSFFNAGVFVSLKKLRNDHNTFSIILVTYSFGSLCMLPFMPSMPSAIFIDQLPLITMMAFAGLLGQWLITFGFKYGKVSINTPITITVIPLLYLVGIVFFKEDITLNQVLGLLLCLGGLTVFLMKK